jgi:hypothetical protein
MSRHFYPGELRAVVRILDTLDNLDAEGEDPKADKAVGLRSTGLEVVNYDDDEVIGTVLDEIGGAWSFIPAESEKSA